MENPAADTLARALAELAGGARTRPISVSLPGPLIDAIQALVEDKAASSTSAVVTEALTSWVHNRLLRTTLDEIYDGQPDLRPTIDDIEAMARRVGIVGPTGGDAVA